MSIKPDPRTKLFMVFIVSAIVLMSATNTLLWIIRIIMTMVPMVLLCLERHYAAALRFLVLYTIAVVLIFTCLSEDSKGFLMSFLMAYCYILVQFMPVLITSWYVIKTTRIDEFVSVMQKMHVPDGITISLAVVMRFFPTIKEEYASIQDAMKMRGIVFGGGNVGKMVEYRMIPLLFSCVNIGNELSAAAITRGLGGKVKRTSVEELKMGIWDYVLIICFAAAMAIFLVFKYTGLR